VWHASRWLGAAGAVLALWACTSRRLQEPEPSPRSVNKATFALSSNRKVDLLFMVDNSSSMSPLQAKMRARLPDFMDALVDPVTGLLPDLHVAVVSSSLGGGAWSNVNQCAAGAHPGDDGGKFQQGPLGNCSMLHQDANFLATGDGTSALPANFDGDIRGAFQCIALLGDSGCGFEAPFASIYYALQKAADPHDPDNGGGFLRNDALLAVVMLTNEDDCSVRGDSLLLDPGVNSVSDPTGLGALASYRCNEFGHLCNGQPPPHAAPASTVTLEGCVSAETDGKTDPGLTSPDGKPDPTQGHLWPTVADFSAYLRQLKANPDDVLVAAIAGPTTDRDGHSLYRVSGQANPAAGGEVDPVVEHSCMQTSGDAASPEYADPAVRIEQLTSSFGRNGIFFPICADDFKTAMVAIARAIPVHTEPQCFAGHVAPKDPKDPGRGHDCVATIRGMGAAVSPTTELPECLPLWSETDTTTAPAPTNLPCYRLVPDAPSCSWVGPASTMLRICRDPSCAPTPPSPARLSERLTGELSCALD
jgi:hypothetical protein